MTYESFDVLQAWHIEKPARSFWVRFHHTSYRPEGFPFRFPAPNRLVEVLAETPEGTLRVAQYHHCFFGSAFRLETRPAVAYDRAGRRVIFDASASGESPA
jgi:hypothetical protein